jgi:hypothetical protein
MKKPAILRALRLAVKQLGVSLPSLFETLRADQQATVNRFFSNYQMNMLTDEEMELWLAGLRLYEEHKRTMQQQKTGGAKEAEAEDSEVVEPYRREDPFLRDLRRETEYREINGVVRRRMGDGWV